MVPHIVKYLVTQFGLKGSRYKDYHYYYVDDVWFYL